MKQTFTTTLLTLIICVSMTFGLTSCNSFTQDDIDNAVNKATAALNEQITSLGSNITEKTAKIATLEVEKAALIAEKTELLANIQRIQAGKATLEAKKETLETEVAALEEEKRSLAADKSALEACLTAKENEITSLNSSISALEAEKATLIARVGALEASITEKDTEIAILHASIATLTAENTDLKKCLRKIHEYENNICRHCGEFKFIHATVKISSDEDFYALSRILSSSVTKQVFFGSSYQIIDDLNRFEYPKEIATANEKVNFLKSASFELTENVSLKLQKANDTSYFMGIGSHAWEFMGTFDGNGKTVTLVANDELFIDDNMCQFVGLFSKTKNATIKNLNIKIENDIKLNSTGESPMFGALVGTATNTIVSNCTVTYTHANVGFEFDESKTKLNNAYVGGLIGSASHSTIKNCTVHLNDSKLYATGYRFDIPDNKGANWYSHLSVGGLLGFSYAGCQNGQTEYGVIGNQLENCNVISNNTTQMDVLIVSCENSEELTAGGMVGSTFNNFVAKNCSVDITKGNIIAQKTGSTDRTSTFGTSVGGFIGRLEHTGELYNCDVNGNSLNIVSKSPENYSTAGGITGVDAGPYHRKKVTINACDFNGNGTSRIILDVWADDAINVWNAMGGIVGKGEYIIKNCTVKGVTMENHSTTAKCFVGNIVGIHNAMQYWNTETYFTPDTPTIENCLISDVVFDTASHVKIGEYVGFQYYNETVIKYSK